MRSCSECSQRVPCRPAHVLSPIARSRRTTSEITATCRFGTRWSKDCQQVCPMIVESDYRGFRIEAVAIETEGAWDAEVRIRRVPFETKARVARLICRKPSAKVAEQRAVIRARQSVDALIATGTIT